MTKVMGNNVVMTATICVAIIISLSQSFSPTPLQYRHRGIIHDSIQHNSLMVRNVFGKKGPKEDLSFIESRDMTREEMLELNKQNEEIMNMELQMMTGFSLVLSLPILYLCWVAFFSD
jgi:PhoPQ-activated pathogenicity-related protein